MIPSCVDQVLCTGPFHVALRNAVRERGLTLERLRAHLARRGISVGLSSLSDWQTGRSRPGQPGSLRTVAALESILGLPPASLARLLGDADGSRQGLADIGPVAELLEVVGGPRHRDMELISTHHRVVIGAHRGTSEIWTRIAVRALRDGVDRYVARYYGDQDGDPGRVRAEPLDNCRLGRLLPHPSEPAVVYEVLFDQALRAGDTWVFETMLNDPSAGVCSEFAQGIRYPAQQCILEVRFHPGALPVAVSAFAQFDLSDDRHRLENLELSKHHTAHLIASSVDSGVLGIQWDWG